MGKHGISFNGVRLAAHHHKIRLQQAFAQVIDRGIFLNGPQIRRLETHLARFLGKGSVITVASGHDALVLALQSLTLPPNSEVILPVNAYPTAFPVALAGLKLIPVDVDDNGQLDPIQVQRAITNQTRVVIMVHLYGLVGDIHAITRICATHHLTLIEDCAQAFGSSVGTKKVGTIGSIGCFSFYPTKNLGSLGDGGAVWTNRAAIFRYIQRAKLYGESKRYHSIFISGHSNLPELQAGGLLVYLRSFQKEAIRRQRVASWYSAAWKNAGLSRFGYILQSAPITTAVPHLMVASLTKRATLIRHLNAHHIPTAIHYPLPIHSIRAFRSIIPLGHAYPNAEKLAARIISLPFHPYMTKPDVAYIISVIKHCYETAAH